MARKEHPQSRGIEKRAAAKVAMTEHAKTAPSGVMWRHKKTGLSGTFKALDEEILLDTPKSLRPGLAERIKVFNEIQRAIEAAFREAKKNGEDVQDVEYTIPWTFIDYPEAAGREWPADKGHIGFIVTAFDPKSYQLPHVCMRRVYDDAGQLIDIRFEIDDGWHRRCAKLELLYAARPADIWNPKLAVGLRAHFVIANSAAEVARSFAYNNGLGKKRMARRDDWRNLIVAEDPVATAAAKLVAEYGLNAETPPRKRGWPYMTNGIVITRMANGAKFGFPMVNEAILRRVLQLITTPANVGVYEKTDALKANFIGGLCVFVALLERQGFAHAAGIEYMLQRPDILDRVEELRNKMTHDDIGNKLRPFSAGVKLGVGEEPTRYNVRAAALVKIYSEYVPQPKRKSGFWSDCPPELRQLLHEAPEIDDDIKRHNFIASVHATLDKKKKLAKAAWVFKKRIGRITR